MPVQHYNTRYGPITVSSARTPGKRPFWSLWVAGIKIKEFENPADAEREFRAHQRRRVKRVELREEEH